MNSTGLLKNQGKDFFLQLLFLINPATKEIRFSNQPLGFVKANPGIASFLRFAESSEPSQVLAEWEKCLLLKPGQVRHFEYKVAISNEEAVIVNLHATGVQMSGDPSDYVLIIINQDKANASDWKNKFDQLQALANSYKKEYREFIDIAAHDLDAPLRKLTTFMERLATKLKSGSQYEELQDYFPRIESLLKEMRSLIDDLSILSRIISSTKEHSLCHIETIIQGIVSGMQQSIKEKKATITTSALPVVKGDHDQLTQLFKNLIENAIKFSKNDIPPAIAIRSAELTTEEKKHFSLDVKIKYYKLEISDNGIGFKQEYSEKIFQPFHRLHGKSQFPGNGIGLAVCKRITDNHQGIIYAKGDEDSGACFTLILPETPQQAC